jgi:hypothetical protein
MVPKTPTDLTASLRLSGDGSSGSTAVACLRDTPGRVLAGGSRCYRRGAYGRPRNQRSLGRGRSGPGKRLDLAAAKYEVVQPSCGSTVKTTDPRSWSPRSRVPQRSERVVLLDGDLRPPDSNMCRWGSESFVARSVKPDPTGDEMGPKSPRVGASARSVCAADSVRSQASPQGVEGPLHRPTFRSSGSRATALRSSAQASQAPVPPSSERSSSSGDRACGGGHDTGGEPGSAL